MDSRVIYLANDERRVRNSIMVLPRRYRDIVVHWLWRD